MNFICLGIFHNFTCISVIKVNNSKLKLIFNKILKNSIDSNTNIKQNHNNLLTIIKKYISFKPNTLVSLAHNFIFQADQLNAFPIKHNDLIFENQNNKIIAIQKSFIEQIINLSQTIFLGYDLNIFTQAIKNKIINANSQLMLNSNEFFKYQNKLLFTNNFDKKQILIVNTSVSKSLKSSTLTLTDLLIYNDLDQKDSQLSVISCLPLVLLNNNNEL